MADIPPQRAQTYHDDVNAGDELPSLSTKLGWNEMALQMSGSQDWNLVHHDPDYAVSSGQKDVFFNTGWTSSMLSRLITDWIGDEGQLREFSFEMRKMNVFGDTVQARGKVTGKSLSTDGQTLVALELWLENDREGITTPAKALVALPARPTGG